MNVFKVRARQLDTPASCIRQEMKNQPIAERERERQGRFRADKHDYQRMLKTSEQPTLFDVIAKRTLADPDADPEAGIDCFCGD